MATPPISRVARRASLSRLLLPVGAAVLVLAVAVALAAYAWVRHYLAGEEFRAMLAGMLGRAAGAEVEVAPLEWDRLAVRSAGVRAGPGRFFSLAKVQEAQASVSLRALTTGVWVIEGARVGSATVDFKLPAKPSAQNPSATQAAAPDAATDPGLLANPWGTLPRWFPQTIQVPEIQIREANLRFGQGPGDFRIIGSGMLLASRNPGTCDLSLRGGTFRYSPFPGAGIKDKTFAIREAKARVSADGLFLLSSALVAEDQTMLSAEGSLPGPGGGGAMDVHYVMSEMPVSQVLGPEWTNRIFGKLAVDGHSRNEDGRMVHEGTAELAQARFLTPKPAAPTAEGAVGLVSRGWQAATSTIVPLLGAYTDRTTQFRNLFCDTATCHYHIADGRTAVRAIKIRSRGLLGIEGDLDITGNNLDGNLMVGVSRETLGGIPGAETKVFTVDRDGLVWTPVRVTGTLDEPKEDLTRRILDAAGQRVLEAVPGLEALKAARRAVEQGTGILKDAPGGLLDQGGKLLQGVLPAPP